MKRTLVRYQTPPERAEENARLIEKVFQELQTKAPEGVRYLVLQLADGTFIHFSAVETADGTSPIPKLEAFRTYVTGIKERCVDTPKQSDAIIVGNYRMLSE